MFSIEELQIAQKFPFSKVAKQIVKEEDFSLEEIPENVILRAKLIVLKSLQRKKYSPQIFSSKEILKDEILAFPTAKIFVSLINSEEAFIGFSQMVAKTVFSNLEKENDETLFDAAKELKINFFVSEKEDFFTKVSLSDFLSVGPKDGFFKLVNQKIESGDVFLSKNEFKRFVSLKFEKQLLDSLPLEVKSVPKYLKSIAKEINTQYFESRKSQFGSENLGELKPEHFPPCIERLYSEILKGKNLTHLERFSIATFMLSAGMPPTQVVNLYSKTPNFDKKVTRYQVMRLAGKGGTKYSAAGCSKMAEYKLRTSSCPCINNNRIKHPLQFYKGQLFKAKKPTSA